MEQEWSLATDPMTASRDGLILEKSLNLTYNFVNWNHVHTITKAFNPTISDMLTSSQ